MTAPGWLLDQTGDGRITVLIGTTAYYLDGEDLDDLSRGCLRWAEVTDSRGRPAGRADPVRDGSRVLLTVGGASLSVWMDDLVRLLFSDAASAELQMVHGVSMAFTAQGAKA
jgi:hypothetical protein